MLLVVSKRHVNAYLLRLLAGTMVRLILKNLLVLQLPLETLVIHVSLVTAPRKSIPYRLTRRVDKGERTVVRNTYHSVYSLYTILLLL